MERPEIRLTESGAEKTVPYSEGETVFEAMRRAGILIDAPCGGRGRCGKCAVRLEGAAPVSPEDRVLLTQSQLDLGYRLACRLKARPGMHVFSASRAASILTASRAPESLADKPPAAHEEEGFGIAVDIGTTTVAAYLCALPGGREIAVEARLSAQRAFGADVITRAGHAQSPEGLSQLSGAIRGQLRDMALALCRESGVTPCGISSFAIVGNTIMLHLLLGASVDGIVRAPFTPTFTDAQDVAAPKIGLPFPNARAYTLPCVSGYVGADTVAAALACGLDTYEGVALLLDIGTNGEIALGGKGGILCCSAAAGPAFEGAHISCGMGGFEGAISAVKIDGGVAQTRVIADAPPAGICGSGLLDAIAEMKRCGAIDETGAFNPDSPLLAEQGGALVFGLAPNVALTQADIRQVQLAKSAIASGIGVLLKESGRQAKDIGRVYLAGGFGNYLDSASACAIGLIPKELLGRVRQVGNAAGAGARLALANQAQAARAGALAKAMRYIELSRRADFSALFIDNMLFE